MPWTGGCPATDVLCLACPDAQAWAAQKTQGLVRHHQLDYLKHDINPIVTQGNK